MHYLRVYRSSAVTRSLVAPRAGSPDRHDKPKSSYQSLIPTVAKENARLTVDQWWHHHGRHQQWPLELIREAFSKIKRLAVAVFVRPGVPPNRMCLLCFSRYIGEVAFHNARYRYRTPETSRKHGGSVTKIKRVLFSYIRMHRICLAHFARKWTTCLFLLPPLSFKQTHPSAF